MKDGFYKVEFKTPLGYGTGAVELRDGRLFGSDAFVAYNGTYSVNGNQFTASVETVQHSMPTAGISNVLAPNASLTINGLFDPTRNYFDLMGASPQAPGLPIDIRLTPITF